MKLFNQSIAKTKSKGRSKDLKFVQQQINIRIQKSLNQGISGFLDQLFSPLNIITD